MEKAAEGIIYLIHHFVIGVIERQGVKSAASMQYLALTKKLTLLNF
jgi:hypothetical protein